MYGVGAPSNLLWQVQPAGDEPEAGVVDGPEHGLSREHRLRVALDARHPEHCGHGLHVHFGCGDGCDCGPQILPGTAA